VRDRSLPANPEVALEDEGYQRHRISFKTVMARFAIEERFLLVTD